MDSWPAPDLPRLPGTGESLRLFDTAAQSYVHVGPMAASRPIRMYVCGITPYDATHLGHAATYLAFDIANRVWRDAGHRVRYIQNVTDIDDPLLERAAHNSEPWDELAARETALFCADMTVLRVLPPDRYLTVVECMAEIVEMVQKLLAAGAAYVVDDGTGDIYFDLTSAPNFGYESHYDRETMLALFAERGGDVHRNGKRDPLDPLLWRGIRPGEPSWRSPMGPGRPGWHIECSVIAISELGIGFDVQGGGSDLIFPHHEMSAAHAEVASDDHPFAQSYVHAGMIEFGGQKMAKSKGNLVFASKLLAADVDPMAIRLALLAGHYRANRPWSQQLLNTATARLARWRAAIRRPAGPDAQPLLANVRSSLAQDLDTPTAIAAIDTWCEATLAGSGDDRHATDLVASIADGVLGITLSH